MIRLQKKKRERMGLRQPAQWRSQRHLRFVRALSCCVSKQDGQCSGTTEAAHVRRGTDCGTSVKPSDFWTLPLCAFHHRQQHSIGEQSFEKLHKFEMKDAAIQAVKLSPCAQEIKDWIAEH